MPSVLVDYKLAISSLIYNATNPEFNYSLMILGSAQFDLTELFLHGNTLYYKYFQENESNSPSISKGLDHWE